MYEQVKTTTAWPADLGWGVGAFGGVGLDWRNRAVGLLERYEDLKFRALFVRNYQEVENLIRNLGPASRDDSPENRADHVRHNINETQDIVDQLSNNPEALDTALDSYYLSKGYRTKRIRELESQVDALEKRIVAAEGSYGTDKVAKISKSPYAGVRIRMLEGAVALPSDRPRNGVPVPGEPIWKKPGFWLVATGTALFAGFVALRRNI